MFSQENLVLAGGSLELTGTGTINADLTLTGTALTLTDTSLSVSGTTNWDSGVASISGTGNGSFIVPAGQVMNVTGAGNHILTNVTLDNFGTVNMDTAIAATLEVNTNSLLNNNAGAVFDFFDDLTVRSNVGVGSFDNAGRVTKSGGIGTATIDTPFNGSAGSVVDPQTGQLSLIDGGIHSGSSLQADGGNLLFAGDHTFDNGTAISGSSNVTFLAGQHDLDGTPLGSSGTHSIVGGSTVTYVNGTGAVISGPLNNSGILELAPLDGVGLTLNDTLTNDGLFDIQDDVNIGGSGDLVTNVTLQKSGGGGSSVVSVPVTSTGLIDSQSGSLELTNGGAHNAGAILQVNPFGDLRLDGDHTLAAGGTITGNGRVFFDGGTHVLDGTYTADLTTVTGTSTVNFNTNANFPTLDVFVGGTANLNGTTYSADFVGLQGFGVDVPTINTSGALTVNSTMSVSDSVLTGSGSVNVANGALLGFTQPFATTVGVDIVNDGTLLVDSTRTDPVTLDPGVTITNNNLLDIVNDLGFDGSGTIDNIGTFQKRASAGTTPIAATFNNSGDVLAQSGTINFTDVFTQTAGSTQLVGGNLSATNPLAIDAGSLSGSGIVGGDVNVDAGTIVVGTSPGSITVDNLNLTDNSNIDTEIGGTIPGTEHDQIILNDTANLDGTINVVLIGGFIPGGETFPLINCGTSCNGLFDATNLPLGFSAQPTAPAFNVQHNLVGTIFFDGTNILVDPFEYNDPLNWSTNVLPVAGDVAVIDLGGGNTITLSGGNHTVDQLFSEEGLSLDGGTLTLAGPGGSVFNDDLAMNGGNLNVADTLDVNADIAWTGASTIDGLGTGTFNIPGASTLTANAAAVFNDIAVVNAGTVNLNADLTLNGTTVFTNQAGATTDIQTAPLFIDGTGTFANEGILRKSALGAVATINADFANSNATIEATDTLRINSASAGFNGTTTLVGAGVELTSVNSTFAPGSVIDGTLTLDNAGTANVQGTLTINDVLNWLAGTVDGGGVGSLLLPGGAVVNQTGIVSFNDIAVSNTGSANLSADLTLGGTTVFTNEVGGVTDISSGLNVSGPGSFVNEGTLRKSAGGIASIAADFTNSDATIDAVTGLQVSGTNADFDGTLNILGGGFEIAATTSTFANGSIVDGTIKLATAGDVIVPGSLIFNDVVDWDDGNIDGQTTGTVTIPVGTVVNVGSPGTHTLTDVTFDNTGGLVNLVGADLLLAGFGVFNNLAGGLVDIQSDVNIVIPPGTSFNNFGVLLKSGGLGVSSIGAFSNAANSLIDVDSGTFQTTADLPNNGIINVANGTTFAVSGFFDNNSTGVIQGSGTIATGASGLTNSGEVIIGASPGILAISGNIVFTINGRLVAELDGVSPGTEHDQLAVTGSATLGGELEVRALGGFVPDIGIDLITCTATCSGNFDTLVESPNVAGTFFVNTTAPVVRLIHSTFGNIFFDNDVGDLRWADPLNWNTNFLPGAGDDPVINLGGGNTIVLDSGIAEVIDTLTIAENFEINGLTSLSLSNNGSSIAGDLTLTESSLIGNGNLTLSSALSAFTIDGGASGSVLGVEVATDGLTQFIGGSSQVTASGGLTSTSNVVFDGATTIATFDAGSLYNVTGDTTIRNGASAVFNNTAATGTLAVTGSSVDGAGTVNVSGATTWTGGDFLGTGILNSNGGLNIGNGGAPRILDRIVNVSGTSLWDGTALTISGGGTVNQSGTVDLQNTGLHDYGFDLVNTGTLDKNAGAGTVLLNGAADNDGTINVSQSSVRLLGGGEHDDGTFNTSGTGIIEFADVHSFRNDTSLNGIDTYLIDLVNPNTALNMNGPGVAAIVGMGITLDFNGQDVGGTAGLDVVGNLNFNAGSTITAFIQGSGNVDFAGNTDLAASQYNLSGGTTTIDPGVSLTLSNPALNGFTSVLNLNGSTDGPGSLSAGTFNLGPGSAINSNMIISTPTAFAQTVNGTGSIINNGVAVDFNADVNLDTVINSGGTSNFNGGTVGGTVTNSSGNANFLAPTFNGVLDGSGTFDNATINGTLNSGVNLTGNNTVNTALSGSNTVQSGTTNFPGGYNPNPGTSMSVGAGATATASSFNIDSGSLSGGGTLGGNVVATGGSISTDVINGNVTLNGGTLSSTNTVNGNVVNNNGTVAPGSSPGTLVINGNFTQGANGLLTMELGGLSQGVDYDLVQITGNAALDGILDVKIFPPFIGAIDVFDLLTYASISDDPLNPGVPSTFANVVMPEGFEFSTSSNFNFDPGLLLSFRLNVTDIPFSETETPDATTDVLTLLIDADGLLDTLNKGGDDGDGDDDGDDDDDDDSEFSLAEDEGTTDDPTSGGTLSCTAASPAP